MWVQKAKEISKDVSVLHFKLLIKEGPKQMNTMLNIISNNYVIHIE